MSAIIPEHDADRAAQAPGKNLLGIFCRRQKRGLSFPVKKSPTASNAKK